VQGAQRNALEVEDVAGAERAGGAGDAAELDLAGADDDERVAPLVLVRSGEIELRGVSGARCAFGRGDLLYLQGVPLRALHNPGSEPAVLVAVSR